MKWLKLFIISALCFAGIQHAQACADSYSSEYCYMFSVYNHNLLQRWRNDVAKQNIDFWNKYFGNRYTKQVTAMVNNDMNAAAALKTLIRARQLSRDADGAHYLALLAQMNSAVGSNDPWDYPSKKEQQRRRTVWLFLLNDASKHINSTKLGVRYWLMAVRAAYYSNNRTRCEQLYNNYASRFASSYLADVAGGYMASYWYKDGQKEKAREYYAKTGDLQSLRWCYGTIDLKGIKALYEETPNSVAFPYLIQDFVNAADNDWLWQRETSPYYDKDNKQASDSIRHAITDEMNGFRQLAARVVREGKVNNAALWQSAAAFCAYIMGDEKKATDELDAAAKMKGTERMMDNIRVLRFLASADGSKTDKASDNDVLNDMKWLVGKCRSEQSFDDYNNDGWRRNHYTDAMLRIVYYHLTPSYLKAGRFTTGTLLTGMTYEFVNQTLGGQKRSSQLANPENVTSTSYIDYSRELFDALDTADVKDVIAYRDLLLNPATGNALEQYAARFCYRNADYYNELIGTKYMRLEEFDKAISYLQKVSLKYISSMSIAPYMHAESSYPLWLSYLNKKQVKKQRYVVAPYSYNPKMKFCQDVLALKNRLSLTSDNGERAKIYYELAKRYAQASHVGSCWALLHYSWTVWNADSTYNDSHSRDSYLPQARAMLKECMKCNPSENNKIKCIFALADLADSPWRTFDYDNNGKVVTKYNPNSSQAQLFKELYAYRKTPYLREIGLTRCDNLRDYCLWEAKR